MIRLTFYTAFAVIIALCAYWISSNPGNVLITWQGWEVRLSLAIFIFLIVVYSLFIWTAIRVLKWLNVIDLFNSPKRLETKRRKAEADMDLAWSAYALGDYGEAIRFGRRAKSRLGDDHNVLRLLASASTKLGEQNNPYLETLQLSQESSGWVNKQKLDQLLEQKDWKAAKPVVKKMLVNHPDNAFLLRQNFILTARSGDWQNADTVLQETIRKKGVFSVAEQKHYKAVIDYCLALEEKAAGRKTESQSKIKSALKNDPSFSPAALSAARSSIEKGDRSSAEKILTTIWKNAPNDELGELLEDLYPGESSGETFRRIKKVTGESPSIAEGAHLLARTAINASHWPEAHKALENLINGNKATKTTFRLMALLEEKQKRDLTAANKFMEQSEKAKTDRQWRCSACQNVVDHYKPICPKCEEFDKITWSDHP